MSEGVISVHGQYRLVDLSQRLSNATSEFDPNPHTIEYTDHRTSAQLTIAYGIESELWSQGEAWAVEQASLSTTAGMNIDAPYHYSAKTASHQARRIDKGPLRWCIGPGVVRDTAHKAAGEGIDADEIEAALEVVGHDLKPLDIMLIGTDVSREFARPGYERRQPGLRVSATEWLVDRGVRLIGSDAWGLDRPLELMAREPRAGDLDQLWESHFLGRRKECCQIEKLLGLDRLPPTGFIVSALPVRLADAGAAWSRAIALVPETPA